MYAAQGWPKQFHGTTEILVSDRDETVALSRSQIGTFRLSLADSQLGTNAFSCPDGDSDSLRVLYLR